MFRAAHQLLAPEEWDAIDRRHDVHDAHDACDPDHRREEVR
jgi:hypothetical protein